MACACNKKWLVVDPDGKIVHRTDTQPKAEAVAARNPGQLRAVHRTTYDKEQKAARVAARTSRTGTPGRPVYEVVTRSGRVVQTTASSTVANNTASRLAHLGATVRHAPTAAPATASKNATPTGR